MASNAPLDLEPVRLTLRERLGRWLLGADKPIPPTLAQLQAEFAQLRLEWADTLDFIQHWAGRQAKRDAKAIKQKLGDPAPDSEPVAHNPVTPMDKSELRRRALQLRQNGVGHHTPGVQP
jgi:hypothetical protein